jgi:diguanylate cyclase (GGDEF)-like protein
MNRVLDRLLPTIALLAVMAVLGIAVAWLIRADTPPMPDIPMAVRSGGGEPASARLRVPGGAERRLQATLAFDLPANGGAARPWMLWMPRDPVGFLRVEGKDAGGRSWSARIPGFFDRPDRDGFASGAYVIALPEGLAGAQELKLELRGSVRSAPVPRIVGLDGALRLAGNQMVFAGAIYAAWTTLLVAALALYWALRDSLCLLYAQYTTAALLFMATVNGHLYQIGWMGWMRGLGAPGYWAVMLLFNALALLTLLRFADTAGSHSPRVRGLQALVPVMVAAVPLALLSLLMPPLQAVLQPLATLAWSLSMLAAIVATLDGARRGVPMAAATVAAMLVLLLASLAHEAMMRGWLGEGFMVRHGYQFALVLMSVILFVGLGSRLALVRRRLDDETSARRDSEDRLRLERLRAGFSQALQADLRSAPVEEIATRAFASLCRHACELPVVRDAVVLGHGYQGNELLLAQPGDRRVSPLAQAALVARGIVRLHARNHEPVYLRIDGARASDDPRAPQYAIVPLRLRPPAWAALVVPVRTEQGLPPEQLHALVELARIAVAHAEEAHAAMQLRQTAEYDALTGSLNRRSLDSALAAEFKPSAAGSPLSVLFIDIDWFKRVNDEHGHACGDQCLRQVAAILRQQLRPADALGRYGGEEFLVLMPGQDGAASRLVAERLRQAVEAMSIEWQGKALRLTISIGMAARRDGDGDAASLLERADKALYAAKHEGRNCVRVAPAYSG